MFENMKGELSCHRVTSNMEADYMKIELIDDASRDRVVRINMSIEQFGNLLSGRQVNVNFEANISHLGLTREHAEFDVPVPDWLAHNTPGDIVRAYLEEHLPEGWIGRASDLGNHHRHFKREDEYFARVTCERWV